MQKLYLSLSFTQLSAISLEDFHFKILTQPTWQLMHGVQYLCQCMTSYITHLLDIFNKVIFSYNAIQLRKCRYTLQIQFCVPTFGNNCHVFHMECQIVSVWTHTNNRLVTKISTFVCYFLKNLRLRQFFYRKKRAFQLSRV